MHMPNTNKSQVKTGSKQHRKASSRKGDKNSSPKEKGDVFAREIGKRIADARDGLGWSQAALHARTKIADSESVGISRSVLSLYELGINKPGAREIRLLCEALKVSPNWLLYGSESPGKAIQAAFQFLRGSDLEISVRLAVALLALDPVERDALASLVFSIATRKLGDVRLSSVMVMAQIMADDFLKTIRQYVDEDAKSLPIRDLLDRFIQDTSKDMLTNWGNLRPLSVDDEEADTDAPLPPRSLGKSK
jgi:transcriptional regulator with XRE-family HTH domain